MRVALAAIAPFVVTACTLAVSTDGLSGGADPADGGGPDASLDTSALADAQTDGAKTDTGASPCPAREPGLIVYYRFDETSDNVARDCSGNGRDGLVAAPTWTSGKRNGALQFDGTSTCVQVGSSTGILNHGAFSIAAWVNVTVYADPTTTRPRYIASKATDIPASSGWRLASVVTSGFGFKLGETAGPIEAQTTDGSPTGQWIHVTSVFDPGKRLEVWLDGALAVQNPEPPAALVDDAAASVHIGCLATTASIFDGLIDDVKIYDRALTPLEISALAR